MKATLTFLIKFYRNQNEEYQINEKIEIDVDSEGNPIDSFWYEQIKFNNGHFNLDFNKKAKK
jgi:hypothetical protein